MDDENTQKIINANYYIKTFYPTQNESDKNFIFDNADFIWNFFNDGYIAAGLKSFLSCLNKKSLRKNANLLKIAYVENIPIAMSIYTGRNGGYKCVGITATTDIFYRNLGKIAAKEIIAYDMAHYNAFFWIVCDNNIKYMCEHRNGIKIPNEYVYLLDDRLKPAENDEYKCYMILNDGEIYEKYVFGFNNEETYKEILYKNDKRIMDLIKKTNTSVYESKQIKYDKYDQAIRIINILYDERCEVSGCFSEQIMDILKDNIKILEEYVKKNINDDRKNKVKLIIENGYDIIDSSTILKLHKF